MVDTLTKQAIKESLETSLMKQKVLTRYASGEIPWKNVAEQISEISKPKKSKKTWLQKIGIAVTSCLVLIFPDTFRNDF